MHSLIDMSMGLVGGLHEFSIGVDPMRIVLLLSMSNLTQSGDCVDVKLHQF